MTPIPKHLFFEKLKSINGNGPRVTRIEGKSTRVWVGFTLAAQLRDEGQTSVN